MQIFYCVLLVFIIFFSVMEICSKPEVNLLGNQTDAERHKYHLYVYTIMFLVIASLLAAERYMR